MKNPPWGYQSSETQIWRVRSCCFLPALEVKQTCKLTFYELDIFDLYSKVKERQSLGGSCRALDQTEQTGVGGIGARPSAERKRWPFLLQAPQNLSSGNRRNPSNSLTSCIHSVATSGHNVV